MNTMRTKEKERRRRRKTTTEHDKHIEAKEQQRISTEKKKNV